MILNKLIGVTTNLGFQCLSPSSVEPFLTNQVRFRLRRGTRLRKEAQKKANKLRKLAREAQEAREAVAKAQTNAKPKRPLYDDSHLKWAVDDIYPKHLYKQRAFSLEHIYNKFQQTHHPSMYDSADALISVSVELNFGIVTKKKLQAKKFSGLICYPHIFEYGKPKQVVAFAKDLKLQELAYEGGAAKAGGIMLMREFEEGKLYFRDFDFVIAAPDCLVDLNTIRVQLDRKFPSTLKGTIGPDIKQLARHFTYGIEYFTDSCPVNMNFGWIDTVVARLNQPFEHVKDNFDHLLKVVESNRKEMTNGTFIRRVVVSSPPSPLKFKLAHWDFLDEYSDPMKENDDKDDEEEEESQTA